MTKAELIERLQGMAKHLEDQCETMRRRKGLARNLRDGVIAEYQRDILALHLACDAARAPEFNPTEYA